MINHKFVLKLLKLQPLVKELLGKEKKSKDKCDKSQKKGGRGREELYF